MNYEILNTESFIEIKYGNIYYELKEHPEDLIQTLLNLIQKLHPPLRVQQSFDKARKALD